MNIATFLFLALVILGITATVRQLPQDGYGLPRFGIDDWRDPRDDPGVPHN